MKAIVWTKYGSPDVLQFREVEKPIPKENEVLIRIHAATVSMGDCELRSIRFSGWLKLLMRLAVGIRRPRKRFSILGQELAGEIEAVGVNVKLFKKGDQVFAVTGFRFGGYAEYVCLPEEWNDGQVLLKPSNMSYEEAAAVPIGGLESMHFLKQANIEKGQTVLISGASGSIGTFAIQIAKYYGAEVTAVGNPTSLEMMKSIGADKVIDYTQEDFTKNGETYDVIFDIIGKSPFSSCKGSLKEKGTYLLANPKVGSLINREKRASKKSNVKYIGRNMDNSIERTEQLRFLIGLIEEGKLKTVIDRRFSLEQVPEAHRYVESGQKTGHVIITLVK